MVCKDRDTTSTNSYTTFNYPILRVGIAIVDEPL